jgi:hypothetical protein
MVEAAGYTAFCRMADCNVLSVSNVAGKGLAFAFSHGEPIDE